MGLIAYDSDVICGHIARDSGFAILLVICFVVSTWVISTIYDTAPRYPSFKSTISQRDSCIPRLYARTLQHCILSVSAIGTAYKMSSAARNAGRENAGKIATC